MANYSVSWDSYRCDIRNGLANLQHMQEFVDMTLAAEGHLVKVHKTLLAIASPYLRELILSCPCAHPVIFLNHVSYEVLTYILDYIYTGETTVPREKMNIFIEATRALHILGVENLKTPEPQTTMANPRQPIKILEHLLIKSSHKGNIVYTQAPNEKSPLETESNKFVYVKNVAPLHNMNVNPDKNYNINSDGHRNPNDNLNPGDNIIPDENLINNFHPDDNLIRHNNLNSDENLNCNYNTSSDVNQNPDGNLIPNDHFNSDENLNCNYNTNSDVNQNPDGNLTLNDNFNPDENLNCDYTVENRNPEDIATADITSGEFTVNTENNAHQDNSSNWNVKETFGTFELNFANTDTSGKINDSSNYEDMTTTTDKNKKPMPSDKYCIAIQIPGSSKGKPIITIDKPTVNTCPKTDTSSVNNTPVPLFQLNRKKHLQMILNRFMYNAHQVSRCGKRRRWRCLDYRHKKCKAYVDTQGSEILDRKFPHNHSFHDDKILKRGSNNKVYSKLEDVNLYLT